MAHKPNTSTMIRKTWCLFIATLLFFSCTTDNMDTDNTPEVTAKLVDLTTIRQAPFFINSVIGYQWNDFYYPGANISIFSSDTSNVIGEFGAADAEEELEIIMELGRKKTIDENLKKYSSINYKKGWSYDVLDAVMLQSDYYITKKGGGTLFFTKDNSVRIEKYLLGSRYVEGFPFSSAGLFRTGHNGFDVRSTLNGIVYFTEDDIFSYDDSILIPMYQFVDYRMLIQLRYLVRNGADNVTLRGVDVDGNNIFFELKEDSDLIVLSNEFEANDIETLWFVAKGDYRVDYFKGVINSNESGQSGSLYIEYRNGESIID